MKQNNETISLRDFYVAAWLLCCGIELISHNKDGGLTIFEFDKSPKVQALIDDYYSLKATPVAMTYSVAIRNLKAIIHGDTIAKRNDYVSQNNR